MAAANVAFSIFTFLAVLLQTPIIVTFVQQKNIAVACLSSWMAIYCFNLFLGSVIWPHANVDTWFSGHVFCDIMVRFVYGAITGPIAAVTAISRNLALATRRQWHDFASFRNRMIDLTISMLQPTLAMVYMVFLIYPRYNVYQMTGCDVSMAPNYLILLSNLPPVIFSLVASSYIVTAVVRLLRVRRVAREVLRESGANMSLRQWFRMFGVCVVVVLGVLPLSLYTLVTTIQELQYNASLQDGSMAPYMLPWNIPLYDEGNLAAGIEVLPSYYAMIILSYVVFLLYGFNKQVLATYKNVYYECKLDKLVFWKKPANKKSDISSETSLNATGPKSPCNGSFSQSFFGRDEDFDDSGTTFYSKVSDHKKTTVTYTHELEEFA